MKRQNQKSVTVLSLFLPSEGWISILTTWKIIFVWKVMKKVMIPVKKSINSIQMDEMLQVLLQLDSLQLLVIKIIEETVETMIKIEQQIGEI